MAQSTKARKSFRQSSGDQKAGGLPLQAPIPFFMQPNGNGRLTVLHVGKYYPPHMGGIETHLQDLCSELRRFVDLRVVVASNDRSASDELLDGVQVSRLATPLTIASAPLCPSLVARIRDCKSDIIHLHLPNPMAVLAYLASGYRGRLVVTYHSDMVRQKVLGRLFEPFLHAALRRSSAIIATSPNYVRTSTVLARHRDRCHIIPLGIPVNAFDQCDRKMVAAIRQQHGDRLIVSVGRLVYYKGFEYLIRAMPRVQGDALIVGEGPLRGSLSALARELGVADRVHFMGKISHELLVACYHAAKVFVLPSVARSEAFGIAQVEAMAAGLPVVNTQLDSGVPFVSLDRKTGLTVPPADPGALAGAMNRLLDDEDLRLSFGNAGRLRAHQEFSLGTMVSRTVSLYRSVMGMSATSEVREPVPSSSVPEE
jgi:glycosyltransferase involved in cell wall biosynthesis